MTTADARRQRQIAAGSIVHSVIADEWLMVVDEVDLENAFDGDMSYSLEPESSSKDLSQFFSQASTEMFPSEELPGKTGEPARRPNGQQMAGYQDSLASQQPRQLQEVVMSSTSSTSPCQEGNDMGIRDSKWDRAALDLGMVLTFENVVDRAALGIGGPPSVIEVVPSISRQDGANNSCCVIS
mmetsp:Transcript_126360/g.404550  ORF Transcript_126360/g.404550 Transcript_126360/m.404550 type:complete len:183 (+) Transcript_126360:66-614(+)